MTSLGDTATRFLDDLSSVLREVQITDAAGRRISAAAGLTQAVELLRSTAAQGGRTWIAGNGGSAAIASHMSLDMWKNGKLPAMAFNDISLLTAIGNDSGFDQLFAEPIRTFVTPNDLVITVSSSGRSPNIIEAVRAAREQQATVITLSAFATDNPLRQLGDLNLYLPSRFYGHAEVGHLALLHAMLDAHMGYCAESDQGVLRQVSPG